MYKLPFVRRRTIILIAVIGSDGLYANWTLWESA